MAGIQEMYDAGLIDTDTDQAWGDIHSGDPTASPTATRRCSTASNTTSSVRRTTTCATTMDRWARR